MITVVYIRIIRMTITKYIIRLYQPVNKIIKIRLQLLFIHKVRITIS
jgi:hypothetical protein